MTKASDSQQNDLVSDAENASPEISSPENNESVIKEPVVNGPLKKIPAARQHEMPFALIQGQPMTQLPMDLYIPPDALEIILEQFEGPLDLLFTLYASKISIFLK